MSKKVTNVIYIGVLLLTLFIFQIFIVNNRSLFGIKPNLILISVIVVSNWYGEKIGCIFGFFIGLITEFLYNANGMFLVSYTVIGILAGIFNTKYNKENKITLGYVTIFSTFIFELMQYFYYGIVHSLYSNIFYFIKQVAISSILNIVIVFVVYSIVYKIIGYFDNRLRKDLSGF